MKNKLNSIQSIDNQYHLHPYTNLSSQEQTGPMVISKGQGIYSIDDNGKKYIEALSVLWCLSLGYGNQRLIAAASKQMEELVYSTVFSGKTNSPSALLSQHLVEMAPSNIHKAYFVNSGSEAIDCAIKFVWYYFNGLDQPAKKKIISRQGAYHGTTLGSSSVAGLDYVHAGADLPISDRFLKTNLPSYYYEANDGETEEEFSTRLANNVEELIIKEDPKTIAAFFAEPIMGAGGVFLPPKDYFQKIQKILKKYNILFVSDEVICGFGRTGKTWGFENFGIVPDIIVCAKQLSAAYIPIGAVMISKDIYTGLTNISDKYGMLGTGHTYGGHPVACAVALETLKIYKEDKIFEKVAKVSKVFLERLKKLSEYDIIETRGLGLLGAIDIFSDKKSKKKFDPELKVGLKLYEKGLKSGYLTRPLPLPTTGVPLCPPLIISADEINQLFDLIDKDINHLSSELAKDR